MLVVVGRLVGDVPVDPQSLVTGLLVLVSDPQLLSVIGFLVFDPHDDLLGNGRNEGFLSTTAKKHIF